MKLRKLTAVILACACFTGLLTATGNAADEGQPQVGGFNEAVMSGSKRDDLYQYYYEKYKDSPKPDEEIYIDAAEYSRLTGDADFGELPQVEVKDFDDLNKNCLFWTNDLGMVEYDFEVKTAGIYNLEFLYYPLASKNNSVDVGLLLDGKYPFSATKNIELDRLWKNNMPSSSDLFERDKKDNDLLPIQVEYDSWIAYPVKDKEGLFSQPYFFYLEAGKHTLSVEGIRVMTVFKSATFKNYPDLTPYAEMKPSESEINATPAMPNWSNDIGTRTKLMLGQNPLYKTSSELTPTYDRTTYLVSPSNPRKIRYNTIGGNSTWSSAGQAATWSFSVPEDGYYRFSAKIKQNALRGFYSNRRVYIDGAVPCEEFDCQKFAYGTRWQQQRFTADNADKNAEDIYIYLEKGSHTITLEAVPGEIGETMQRLEGVIYSLNYYYRRILMITGPNPDEFYPYYLDKQIPDLLPAFRDIINQLSEEKARIERYSSGGSEAATLQTMIVILQRCINKPDWIPMMKRTLQDNIISLSAWTREKSHQPLEIDYIEVATVHETFGKYKPNLAEELWFGWEAFIGSFFEDYTKLDDGEGVNVWVGLGRDQALVIKQLVDNDYNVTHEDMPVTINLVQGSILEATLAGKGPEVALFIGGDFPVQLAARKLTVDLTKFPDYDDIVNDRFTEQLPTFFTYRGGVYGLPISQSFPMMFYREDILSELGIDPPETWDDFKTAIAVLNRAHLEIGLLPPTSNLSSTIFEPGDTFAMLQLQTGLNFYNEDLTQTTFDQEASIDAFTLWTKFYTVYKFEQTYDPFSRFRTGEMPIVIQPYTFYNQLYAAAPEIKGLWNFTHVPGTVRKDENGNDFVDFAASSSSWGAVIFDKTKDKQTAWEFIKWFTSDEIQTRYGKTMEAMLGPMGRFDTANKNSIGELSWSAVELYRLTEQRDACVEIPMIPANYSTTRHVKNAFRAVVNENTLPRYALNSYNRDINAEIARKNAEIDSYDN